MINALISANVEAVCGTAHAEISQERANGRNGYQFRRSDTWVGSLDIEIDNYTKSSTALTCHCRTDCALRIATC